MAHMSVGQSDPGMIRPLRQEQRALRYHTLVMTGLLLCGLTSCVQDFGQRPGLRRDTGWQTLIWDYTYKASTIDSQVSARAVAVVLVKRRAWEDLATSLQDDAARETVQLTTDQMTACLAGVVQPRIVQEHWDGDTYRLQARMRVNLQRMLEELVALSQDQTLLQTLEDKRQTTDNALQELEHLKQTLLDTTRTADKFAAQARYSQQVGYLVAADWVAQGIFYTRAQQYEAAMAVLTLASELNPDDTAVYTQRASVAAQMDNYEAAIQDLTQVVELSPRDAEGYRQRGNMYHMFGRALEALADFTHAITLEPQSAVAYHDRGVVLEDIDQPQKALADFTHAITLEPQFVVAYYNRGTVYQRIGHYKQALADFTRAIELNQNDAGAYNNRGVVYSMQGMHEQALADFTRAIGLAPQNAIAYYNRGRTLSVHGDSQRALHDYKQALVFNPQLVGAYYHRGKVFHALHNYAHAIRDYTMTIELEPQHAEAYYQRGRAYIDVGDLQRAVHDYRMAVTLGSKALIREVQERLHEAEFSPGPIDGVLGPRTQAALRWYQAAHDLSETGILDAATIRVLLSKAFTTTDS